ncbi:Gfo/Idh/MocA family protein [Paenibacillus turpanensis]|uniref:Gfo/Idh/MocA family protein n=1 Tax=Paenibacillus turpanensis TaxID=2689078 RepID=UPI00140E6527|nr:Gfo/Idh/MocA family oxidoreductase [Paenibacillus turpanensis]
MKQAAEAKHVKIGIIGCGNISAIYCKNLTSLPGIEVTACADLDVEKARSRAVEYGIPKACSVEELLADPEVQIVVNLTIPAAHADVCLQALEAGKHVYVEKPLAVSLEDGKRIMETAERRRLLVGSAPDTFLGGGIQTCKALIEAGEIGEPLSCVAFMMSRGHEHWHPAPEFYYQAGGGPMFDMGPYYLTALIALIGPIAEVSGMTRVSFPERTITSEPKRGQKIQVDVPTHVTGLLRFEGGAVGTIITSFDIPGGAQLPRIEIYGSEGSLSVPDPNTFGGPVLLRKKGQTEWTEIAVERPFTENSRGLGVWDMARSLQDGSKHRASGALALHVLEAMHAFHFSSDRGAVYTMTTKAPELLGDAFSKASM